MLLNTHLLAIGPTGVGKSNFLVDRGLEMVSQRISFTAVLPHDPPYHQLIAEIYARLKGSVAGRLIVEDVGNMQHVIMRPFVYFSTAGNYYDQKLEDRLFEERALEPAMARLSESTKLSETQAKEKYARLAIRLFQPVRRNGVYVAESDIPYLLDRDHPIQEVALQHCGHDQLRREIQTIRRMPQRDYSSMVLSAIRFLEPIFQSPVIEARTSLPPNFDWPAFFHKGGIHLITKGKASDEDFRVFCQADFLMKYRMAMDGLLPAHYYKIDEVNNYGLCGAFEAKALSTSRYQGFFLELYTQLLDFPSDQITNNVLTNCAKAIFLQDHPDMQEFAARELRALMDREKVHHHDKTVRQVHDGFDEIDRKTEGKTMLASGETNKSENISKQLVAKYREVVEERPVFEGPHDQVFWQAQRLGEIPIGSCWIKERARKPYLLQVPLVRSSFFKHNIGSKIQECLTIISQRPPYETPAQPTLETTTPSQQSGMIVFSDSSAKASKPPQNNSSKRGSSNRKNGRGGGARR